MPTCHRPGTTSPDQIKIAPSILAADHLHLADELAEVASADLIHVDVMDGHFVPEISFGSDAVRAVKASTELPVDVHLMVSNPDEVVDSYLNAGADFVSFHYEAACHPHRIVAHIRECGAKAAIAINPGTPVSVLDAILYDVDMVLVMTVDPGYGGQPFVSTMPHKLRQLRRMCDEHGVSPLIEVDGGIVPITAAKATAAGATVLVTGSAVFGSSDRAAAIEELRQAALEGCARRA